MAIFGEWPMAALAIFARLPPGMDNQRFHNLPPAGLAYWHDAIVGPTLAGRGGIEPEAFERLLAHPRFAEACFAYARNLLANRRVHPALATGGGDLTVPVFSAVALCLALQGELTLAAIQAFCQAHRLASPGRAAGLMTQLRKKGYIVPHPEQPAGRARRYMAASILFDAYRGFFGRSLAAFGIVEPEAASFVERIAEDQIFAALMSRMLLGLINILRVQDTTPVTHFVLRNGGLMVLYHLCLSGESGGVFPPVDPVPYSVAGLARAYGLSRSHILRMLREAEDLGYVQRNGDSTIRFEQNLRDALIYYQAINLLGNAACAHSALQEAGAPRATAADS
jgi:hypothetical protein